MSCGIGILATVMVLSAAPGEPQWLSDYGAALQQCRREGVPLLVILDDPADATHRIDQVSRQRDEVLTSVLNDYKLCHVDVSTDYGRRVAQAFRVTSYPHTSIIDNSGSVQIFRKSGAFSTGELVGTLAKYRQGELPAQSVSRQTTSGRRFCFT